jgi:hypothetical protein
MEETGAMADRVVATDSEEDGDCPVGKCMALRIDSCNWRSGNRLTAVAKGIWRPGLEHIFLSQLRFPSGSGDLKNEVCNDSSLCPNESSEFGLDSSCLVSCESDLSKTISQIAYMTV